MAAIETIILITERFPLSGVTEKSFVSPEISILASRVNRLIIVPLMSGNIDAGLSLPSNVEVCRGWCDSRVGKSGLLRCVAALSSVELWKSLSGGFSRADITYTAAAVAFSRYLVRFIKQRRLNTDKLLVYSFWLNFAASGAYLAAEKLRFRYVSRAHGYDYMLKCAEDLRRRTVEASCGVYLCSDFGAGFLKKHFAVNAKKVFTAYLGVSKRYPESLTIGHKVADRKVTFLSVSRVIPRKRVDMNLRFMKALAVARPGTLFKWIHVGDGESLTDIAKVTSEGLPCNLEVDLRGELDNDALHTIYRDETIDWLMLLSEQEPLGLVLVEAMAYGVPVVATAVGGIPEVVTDDCGLLLDKDSTPEEFIRGILPYIDSDYRMKQMRASAYNRWRELFDAKTTRNDFVNKIISACS